MREGYLTKKPLRPGMFSSARRRYFVLTDHVLEWSEDRGLPIKGTMPLNGAMTERTGEALVLIRKGEKLILSGEDLDGWDAAIQRAIDRTRLRDVGATEIVQAAEGRAELAELATATQDARGELAAVAAGKAAAETKVKELEAALEAANKQMAALQRQLDAAAASTMMPPVPPPPLPTPAHTAEEERGDGEDSEDGSSDSSDDEKELLEELEQLIEIAGEVPCSLNADDGDDGEAGKKIGSLRSFIQSASRSSTAAFNVLERYLDQEQESSRADYLRTLRELIGNPPEDRT